MEPEIESPAIPAPADGSAARSSVVEHDEPPNGPPDPSIPLRPPHLLHRLTANWVAPRDSNNFSYLTPQHRVDGSGGPEYKRSGGTEEDCERFESPRGGDAFDEWRVSEARDGGDKTDSYSSRSSDGRSPFWSLQSAMGTLYVRGKAHLQWPQSRQCRARIGLKAPAHSSRRHLVGLPASSEHW